RLRHHLGDHPVPSRAGQRLPTGGVHRRLEPLLPTHQPPIRTIRTTLISAGHPRYGCHRWYGSIRTRKPIRTSPEQEKRAWYGWYGYPGPTSRYRRQIVRATGARRSRPTETAMGRQTVSITPNHHESWLRGPYSGPPCATQAYRQPYPQPD